MYLFMGGIIVIILTLVAVTIFTKPKLVPVSELEKKPVEVPVAPEATPEPVSQLESKPVEVLPVTPAATPQFLPPVEEKIIFKPEFQKGMTFIAWTEGGYNNPNSVKAMEQMASLGIEWACLVPTWYQYQYNSPKISPLRDRTTSDESLIFAIRKLHELKFKLMLKPHLDLVQSNGKWRGEIGFTNPGDWQAWFESYTAFILHYAEIAAGENVEILCIGTELTNAAISQPAFWKELINKIRQVYKGQLTYAANWSEEFDAIEFWNELDYAGIDPYFPLVTSLNPTVEQLKSAWEDWIKKIEPWQKKINKPVIITEIGYKSAMGANEEPWQHAPIGGVDLELQVNCYEALLEAFWDKPWVYGVYWWYWGVHPKMGGDANRGFTPQNKPAGEVVSRWYKEKPVSGKAY
ncbi:MAG: hypothetical protein ABIH75_02515 [Candidatus Omnitrophota bacterium]